VERGLRLSAVVIVDEEDGEVLGDEVGKAVEDVAAEVAAGAISSQVLEWR